MANPQSQCSTHLTLLTSLRRRYKELLYRLKRKSCCNGPQSPLHCDTSYLTLNRSANYRTDLQTRHDAFMHLIKLI